MKVMKALVIKVYTTNDHLFFCQFLPDYLVQLLGWMPRKFRQNGCEAIKDLAIGNSSTCLAGQPSLDDQKPNFHNTKPFKFNQKDQLRNSFASFEAAATEEEEEYYEVEPSDAVTELFHGFLAIGTFGSDPINTDPSTPTFSFSVENITEKETEATENELKLINDELEKVLIAEDASNISSGRTSHVSNGRSSHGSTITLSGKILEAQDTNESNVCPLQGYLLGSAFEVSETTRTSSVAKKENRTSLGELFQRTKIAEENLGGAKLDKEDKKSDKETGATADKSAVNLMKKILKKKMPHASSRNSSTTSTVDSASAAETKLKKILQMFHRKVHPENTTTAKNQHEKPSKNENNKNGGQNNGEGITAMKPQRALSKGSMRRYQSQSNPPQFSLSDSNGNRECWIKTDADCKYQGLLH
ncbi:protein LAZY 1-like isoform X1 [Tripterygium wilfordii]|uniref:protein LAZY 1-like isoform X1 n=1 Tax=Tripterygium wilfordii TaxID=458696 RepID=UPI0018F82237|nr:protein LAZY 1-like isoform X1 [Tripterygium wilfordii]